MPKHTTHDTVATTRTIFLPVPADLNDLSEVVDAARQQCDTSETASVSATDEGVTVQFGMGTVTRKTRSKTARKPKTPAAAATPEDNQPAADEHDAAPERGALSPVPDVATDDDDDF